ncbi:MAG: SH3 domain-containing protein [Pseudomonadota bacterium]
MKIPRSALICILLLVLPGIAAADSDGPDYFAVTGVAADDVLHIRSEPLAGSTKIGEIPPDGDGLRNLGCIGGLNLVEWEEATEEERERGRKTRWCQIEYQGLTGWVAGWLLREGSDNGSNSQLDAPSGSD